MEKKSRVESPDTMVHPCSDGAPLNSKDEFVRRLLFSSTPVGLDLEHPPAQIAEGNNNRALISLVPIINSSVAPVVRRGCRTKLLNSVGKPELQDGRDVHSSANVPVQVQVEWLCKLNNKAKT